MMSRVLPILFVLIAGALFFGYINPTVTGSIAETNKQIKQYDAALAAAKRFEQKQTQLALEQKALPVDGLTRIKAFLPDGVDNVQLILDLDGVAARSGLKILNFNTTESKKQAATTNAQPGQASASASASAPATAPGMGATVDVSKPYDSLDLSITASGTYPELRSFLASIETSLRPLDLVEFQLADSSTGVYTYQMTFRLYWLR